TVATNMAGRGTDIILGGNQEANGISVEEWQREHDQVVALGGLLILGTERHEARRIDNQLRGRSGRQGDPGSSRFYVSLEDDLMRRFGGDRIKGVMDWIGMEEDEPLENRLITKSIETAQTKVEAYHFEIRKHLVEYDDVANLHRQVIYEERQKLLGGADLKANIQDMVRKELRQLVATHLSGNETQEWNPEGMVAELRAVFPVPPSLAVEEIPRKDREWVAEALLAHADRAYQQYEEVLGSERMRQMEREVMLRTIDIHWVQHLTAMENLRTGIGLQAYGQRDPLVAFKQEAHEMFQHLLESIQHDIARTVFRYADVLQQVSPERQATAAGRRPSSMAVVAGARRESSSARKVGRNDPCPCGSGKKYKKCHGAGV
ncbi:MAG: preprotein translocase subunit SecA, partial [Dehalococcoidia bacterium]|nr:preprotein translocase subunit SecA [Dehalococcoidia bacterium]